MEGVAWILKWNAGSWLAPPLSEAASAGWAVADAFKAADCEACFELAWSALPGVAPGSVISEAAGVFAAAKFDACGSVPCPTPPPGMTPGLASSVAAAFADADSDACSELAWSAL